MPGTWYIFSAEHTCSIFINLVAVDRGKRESPRKYPSFWTVFLYFVVFLFFVREWYVPAVESMFRSLNGRGSVTVVQEFGLAWPPQSNEEAPPPRAPPFFTPCLSPAVHAVLLLDLFVFVCRSLSCSARLSVIVVRLFLFIVVRLSFSTFVRLSSFVLSVCLFFPFCRSSFLPVCMCSFMSVFYY